MHYYIYGCIIISMGVLLHLWMYYMSIALYVVILRGLGIKAIVDTTSVILGFYAVGQKEVCGRRKEWLSSGAREIRFLRSYLADVFEQSHEDIEIPRFWLFFWISRHLAMSSIRGVRLDS